MTMVDLTCPKCGGMREVSPDQTKCICPYCDNELLVQPDTHQPIQHGQTIVPEMQTSDNNEIPVIPRVVLQPPKTGKLASGTVAMVIGIISMITFGAFSVFGIIAVIAGIRCLKKKPNQTQKIHALIGIITGGIGALMFAGLLLST